MQKRATADVLMEEFSRAEFRVAAGEQITKSSLDIALSITKTIFGKGKVLSELVLLGEEVFSKSTPLNSLDKIHQLAKLGAHDEDNIRWMLNSLFDGVCNGVLQSSNCSPVFLFGPGNKKGTDCLLLSQAKSVKCHRHVMALSLIVMSSLKAKSLSLSLSCHCHCHCLCFHHQSHCCQFSP